MYIKSAADALLRESEHRFVKDVHWNCPLKMLPLSPAGGGRASVKKNLQRGVDEQGEWRIQDLVHPLRRLCKLMIRPPLVGDIEDAYLSVGIEDV
jgi:hypothetical protein